MRKYETIFIAHPDLGEDEVKGLIEKMRGIIESLNGQLIKVEDWGRRKLAYKVKKVTKGYYVLVRFLGNGEVLAEIERNLRLWDGVLKYQSVRLDGKGPEEVQTPVKEVPQTEGTPETEETPKTEGAQEEGEADVDEKEVES
jgi:small subunit ribosomal protein S6